jgi:hypothetical protein
MLDLDLNSWICSDSRLSLVLHKFLPMIYEKVFDT